MDFIELYWVILGFTEFILGLYGYYCVILGCSEFTELILGFYW